MGLNLSLDDEKNLNSRIFLDKLKSEMNYKSLYNGDLISFEWLEKIEFACPYIDIIVRNPKLTLIQEENLVKVERSKRITVASVKDLAKHTQYIEDVDKKTNDVRPSKILDIRNEETYNIYENRFLYTLINDLHRFVADKEKLLNNFEINKNKTLEYKGSSVTKLEKVNIEVKVSSTSLPTKQDDKKLEEEINDAKKRLKRVNDYLFSWDKSEMVKALAKEHVNFVSPPLKKTNILLKNPNFRIAVRLWDYIRTYDLDKKDDSKESDDNNSIDIMKSFLDHSFLIDYAVMDSMVKLKREQKKNMTQYAVVILTEEIGRVMDLLASCGYKTNEDELLSLIAKQLKDDKKDRLVGAMDVKKKFKSAMEEYLERTQKYL